MIKNIFVTIGRLNYLLFGWLVNITHRLLNGLNTGYYISGMKSADSTVSIEYPTERIVGRQYVSLGQCTTIGKHAVITAWDKITTPEITIGSHVAIGDDCHITASNKIVIGDGTLFGKKVTVTDNSHGGYTLDELAHAPITRDVVSKGPVIIGKNVWIGDKATICPGVTIGDGAVIGANSVVTHNIPSYTIAAGVPASVIKEVVR